MAWTDAFRKAKSMGFSVPVMAGDSEVTHAQRRKKARKTHSMAMRVRHSFRAKSDTASQLRHSAKRPTIARSPTMEKMAGWELGMVRVRPTVHRA